MSNCVIENYGFLWKIPIAVFVSKIGSILDHLYTMMQVEQSKKLMEIQHFSLGRRGHLSFEAKN